MTPDIISRKVFESGALSRSEQHILNAELGVSKQERERQRGVWAQDIIDKAKEASILGRIVQT
jgi:hypothetical protein